MLGMRFIDYFGLLVLAGLISSFGFIALHSATQLYVAYAMGLPLKSKSEQEKFRLRVKAMANIQLFDHMALTLAIVGLSWMTNKTYWERIPFAIFLALIFHAHPILDALIRKKRLDRVPIDFRGSPILNQDFFE